MKQEKLIAQKMLDIMASFTPLAIEYNLHLVGINPDNAYSEINAASMYDYELEEVPLDCWFIADAKKKAIRRKLRRIHKLALELITLQNTDNEHTRNTKQ